MSKIDAKFFEDVILSAKAEQDRFRINHAKQDGVIAFCEIVLRRMAEEEKAGK